MSGVDDLWSQVGISGAGVLGVVLATVVLYLLYAAVVQLAGPRLMANPSVFSFSVMALLGALCARAMLGEYPTLAGAAVAMVTLLLLEAVLGRVRGRMFARIGLRGPRPTVVVVRGHVVAGLARRRGLGEAQLLALLRRAGVHRMEDAALVILENRGTLTVVREGARIDRRMLQDVAGRGLVPESLLAP